MRFAPTVLALLILLAQTASAAEPLPHFRKDTHYPVVRARMIKLGFEPAHVLKRSKNSPMGCGYPATNGGPSRCKRWPEILHCSEGVSRCDFLYFHKNDGAWVIVTTEGDNDVYNCYCFVEVRFPDAGDEFKLEEAVIASSDFAGHGARRGR